MSDDTHPELRRAHELLAKKTAKPRPASELTEGDGPAGDLPFSGAFKNLKTGEVRAASEQPDLFEAHMLDANIKDDVSSMAAPFFALSTKDGKPWRWESKDKQRWLEMTPSPIGRATMHDKDVLLYLISVMVQEMDAALRNGEPMPSKRILLNAHDFFIKTGRDANGEAYDNLIDGTLARLGGTMVQTNIGREPNVDVFERFPLLAKVDWEVVKSANGKREFRNIMVTLSDWHYYAIQQREVLTLHSDYFKLRKPIERRLYELARKHIGRELDYWKVNADTLYHMVGTRAAPRRFHNMMLDIRRDSNLPEFVIEIESLANGDVQWQFWRKAPQRKRRLKLTKVL